MPCAIKISSWQGHVDVHLLGPTVQQELSDCDAAWCQYRGPKKKVGMFLKAEAQQAKEALMM